MPKSKEPKTKGIALQPQMCREQKRRVFMKKFIFPVLLVSLIALSGCKVVVSPKQQEKKLREETMQGDVTALKQTSIRTEDKVRKFTAEISADMDTLRQEQTTLHGTIEETDFKVEEQKESIAVLVSTVAELETKLNDSIAANSEKGSTTDLQEIKISLAALSGAYQGA